MKRGSLMTPVSKREAWRKYPSAVFKVQIPPVVAVPPVVEPTFIPQFPITVSLNIVTMLCEDILELTDQVIEQIEENKFIEEMQSHARKIELFIYDAILPSIESAHLSVNSPEDEPIQSAVDYMCSGQKHMEKRLVQRQAVSISAFNTPLRQWKQKEKISISSKNLYPGPRKSLKNQLIPLPSVECEEDLRSTILQTFYRDKIAKEDEINQQENLQKPQLNRTFRKTNRRDKGQFAFDYDGERIPINSCSSLKNNPVKVLKTIYKVPKERTDLKYGRKTHFESIRSDKFPETIPTNKFLDPGADLRDLKKGIQQSVRWAGKLQSIKLITEHSQTRKQ